MGAAEIKGIKNSGDQLEIELTDAGARDGNLVFHSKKPLSLVSAEGQAATVEPAGDNLWKVHVKDRLRGKPQKITLRIGS